MGDFSTAMFFVNDQDQIYCLNFIANKEKKNEDR